MMLGSCLIPILLLFSSCKIHVVLAWSSSSSPGSSLRRTVTPFAQKGNADSMSFAIAEIPRDLPAIQACRATVDFAARAPNLLNAERAFLEASALSSNSNNLRCVVARRGKTILATADCRINYDNNEIYLNNIFVRPKERGKGLGKRLIIDGVETLMASTMQSNGSKLATSMTLTVYTQNKAAVALYTSCGFKADGPLYAGLQGLANAFGGNLLIQMRKQL